MWFFDLACLKRYTQASDVGNTIDHKVHSRTHTLIVISRDYHLVLKRGVKN